MLVNQVFSQPRKPGFSIDTQGCEDSDGEPGAHRVAVIDEAMANQYWRDDDAIGHRFSTNPSAFDEKSTYSIVGIVGNVKQNDLTETQPLGAAYLPYVGFPKFQVII